jgi:hypothetical protein
MCSMESLLGAWIDPWLCTLVAKTLVVILGPPDVFWGILV